MAGFTDRLYKNIIMLARKTKEILTFPQNVMRINQIVGKPSYYPEMERKSRNEMWKDNFKWLCKHHELNIFYTSYGLDIRGFRNPDDFIPHREFCVLRDLGNQKKKYTITGKYTYIVLLRDKYIFSAYLSSAIGKQYVVDTKALISAGNAFVCSENKWCSVSELFGVDTEYVYKKIDGECADGVMLVQGQANGVMVDGTHMSQEQFIQKLGKSNYIVQNVIIQHQDLNIFKTKSVNTIRIITIMGQSGAVDVFAAFLRLSGSAESFVDNRAKGGIGVGIELDTGRLMQYGFPHDAFGVKVDHHPISGVKFADVVLPYWNETVELVCNAHKQFYELQSIGWDVVLTQNGPVLLEGNDDWEIGGPQDTYGGLKNRWNDLVSR